MYAHSIYRLLAIAACIFPHFSPAQAPAPLPATKRPFIVVAHRGDHELAPENTLQAYSNAIKAGADYVEIDLRTTADSQLVIMHDGTVDRMTNGKGQVSQLRYDSLRRLTVRDRSHPEWGRFQIPHFSEVLELCRDKIHIYLDFKNADPSAAYEEIVRHGMQKQVVVYINSPAQFTGWRKIAPAMPLMVSLPENIRDEKTLREFLERYHPDLLDGDAGQYTPEMVHAAALMGVSVIPDIQGADEGPAKWEAAMQKGFVGLQTDHPGGLIAWLKTRGTF